MSPRLFFLTALAAVTLSSPVLARKKPAPTPSAAPVDEHDQAARRFYETGSLLFNRGQFLDAARQFELAYAEKMQPALLYNIAAAYDKGGERAKAVESYRKYVETMPGSPDTAIARARADVLDRERKELEAARSPERKLPPALPYTEPVSKHSFATRTPWDGKEHTLLGVGLRKYFGFKVYAMGLYIEDEPARKAFPRLAASAGGSDKESLARNDLAQQWYVMSDFGKAAVLYFMRDVTAKDTRSNYRDALGDAVNDKAPPDLKKDAEAFLDMFDDVKAGGEITIRTNVAGQVFVDAGGKTKAGPTNLRLSHDIWDIWLGRKPISSDLKKGLVDRIDTLGR